MRAVHLSSAKELANQLAVAETFAARLKGLLGCSTLPPGAGLWIKKCRSIHTFGMQFPIDVLFLDRENQVVGLAMNLAPNRLSRWYRRASSVIELPAGTLEAMGARPGDQIDLVPGAVPKPRLATEAAAEPETPAFTAALCYLLLLLAHLVLVWALPYFPSQDGPSHLYNLVILDDLLHGGRTWGEFYSYRLHPSPNLGFHLIAYPLLKLCSPYGAERAFLSLYLLLMAAAVPFWLRSFRKQAFPLSFLVFPVLFNYTLMMGFYSYSIAVPLCIAALGICWRSRHRAFGVRLALMNLMAVLLYFCHLTAFALFLLAVTVQTLAEERETRALSRLGQSLLLAAPQLLLVVHYLAQAPAKPLPHLRQLFSLDRLGGLLTELFLCSTVTFRPLQVLPAALLLLCWCLLALPRLAQWRLDREAAQGERYLAFLAGSLFLVYLAVPNQLSDGAYLNKRLPWVIFLLSLPLLSPDSGASRRRWGKLLIPVAGLFLFLNVTLLWSESLAVGDFVAAHNVALPAGSQVANYRPLDYAPQLVDPLLHAVSHNCLARQYVDVGNYETGYAFFPVRFSEKLAPLPAPEAIAYWPRRVAWGEYPTVGYLFGLNLAVEDRNELARWFRVISENGEHSVWQRVPGQAARAMRP